MGEVSGACSALATGWPGIAVPPGTAHSLQREKIQSKINVLLFPSGWSVRQLVCYLFFISIHAFIASCLKCYALCRIRYDINYDDDDSNTYNKSKITIIKK